MPLSYFSILLTEKIEKPSDNTKIKISDFGLSKIISQVDSCGREAMTGQLGTCVSELYFTFSIGWPRK